MAAFRTQASQPGQIRNDAFPPTADTQRRPRWPFRRISAEFLGLAQREGYSFALAERGIYIVEFADAAASPFDGSTMRGLSGALCPRR
jgi:hypothetical protein